MQRSTIFIVILAGLLILSWIYFYALYTEAPNIFGCSTTTKTLNGTEPGGMIGIIQTRTCEWLT